MAEAAVVATSLVVEVVAEVEAAAGSRPKVSLASLYREDLGPDPAMFESAYLVPKVACQAHPARRFSVCTIGAKQARCCGGRWSWQHKADSRR